MTEQPSDWCVDAGELAVCGTRMRERRRTEWGTRWCFHCRTRHTFDWVLYVPDGPSYYGPHAEIEGRTRECTDVFPGWSRDL